MTTFTPRQDKSGVTFTISANLTGSNGDTGRTFSLTNNNSIIQGMSVYVQGASLQYGLDYTFSSGVITFTNAIYDAFEIVINYFTQSSSSSGIDTTYATTEQLSEFMLAIGEVPNPETLSDNRALETVAVGDGTTTRYYLDRARVLANTYTLYYGATEAAALSQSLTETTHYTLDKDAGIITLTSTGATLISTSNIYAAYKYNTQGFKDSVLQDRLNEAADYIDNSSKSHFANGTDTTPDWEEVVDEKHDGKGHYDKNYNLNHSPIPDVSTTLSANCAIGDTSITVVSTQGFPATGYLNIGSEKVVYTAKGSTTFTVTALTAAHTSGDEVLPFVFEVSTTQSGIDPSWTVLQKDVDYDLDYTTGRVHLYDTDATLVFYNSQYPPAITPNRFKATYIHGYDEIPRDIKKLTLMMAGRDLMNATVRKAHASGMNDFQPSILGVDDEKINSLMDRYRRVKVSNI